MGVLETLSLLMGTAWTSGINLYATVAVLGLAGSHGLIQLPPNLEILMHPLVIGVACVMYVVEFFADKVPYVDSGWDALHTLFRIPAGAVLAWGAAGDVNPALQLVAILAGGAVATAAHGTKMVTRLAINTSPEPFSNWTASIAEDISVFAGLWAIFNYPLLMILFVLAFCAVAVWMLPKIVQLAKRGFRAIRSWFKGSPDTQELTKSHVVVPPA
jgi:Domain of unknown function (DUF4126)